MAHILPVNPPQSIPSETLRVYKALKLLPDSYWIWHHLAPWQPNAPDFLVITHKGQALIIKVSLSSATQATPAAQLLLLDDHRAPLGTTEANVLTSFVQGSHLPENESIETLVIFPNIANKQVQESRLERKFGEPEWVGREILQPESLNLWERFFASQPIQPIWLEKIRQQFSPEVVVPASMTVRPIVEHRLQAGLIDYLLDYNQEAAVKSDLDFGGDGETLGRDLNLNIINGVAGSGKTLILLYRLRVLYNYYPDKKYLVLTHNRPLERDLESRFYRLVGRLPETIEWCTFNKWCYSLWPKEPVWKNPISIHQRQRIIRQVWTTNLQGTNISERMLLSEIDWLNDQLPMTQNDYVHIDRRGRGFGLSSEQRLQMWNATCEYKQILNQNGSVDWGDIPQLLWHYVEIGKVIIPQYDFILIDEAQFFAPLWMNLIQKALKPKNSHLFIVADPTQGFLGRKATWKSLGLDARGHSHSLRRSYRTTREIMQFATLFYRLRLPGEKDDEVLTPDILNMPPGVIPQVILLTSSQDEIYRVANEVAEFIRQGYPREHLLLLHANGQGVNSLIQAINSRLGKNAAIDPKKTYPGHYVRVTTINAGTGLESPIVFLVGLRELFEEEQSIRLSDEEREELVQENTRKIFMACTRAGQRLVFTFIGDIPIPIKQSLER